MVGGLGFIQRHWGFHGGSDDKESACNAGDPGSIPGSRRSPKKEMTSHSSILAWKIPRTEEPGGLQAKSRTRLNDQHSITLLMGSRVGPDLLAL